MRIAYLLHRFPVHTDTFIRREIRGIQAKGTEVEVISVWKPKGNESTASLLDAWSHDVTFLLPSSILSVLAAFLAVGIRSPRRLISAIGLAFETSRPGIRGTVFQLFYLAEAILAANALSSRRIDHIHNHFGDHSGTIAMLASRLTDIGYSISFHGPHIFFDALGSAIPQKVGYAKFTRCISYYCCSQLIVLSKQEKSSFKIIHCGLELERYKFRVPRDKTQDLFCVARVAPEKGINYLIQAVAALVEGGHAASLRIAGDGPGRSSLEKLAEDLGIAKYVHFLGNLGEEELIRELSLSDLFALPSLAEGLPVSLMEAMAIGVPVIATNIAGVSELVENGQTGLLVRPADPDAIVKAVIAMAQSHEFRVKLAVAARAKIECEFDIATECAKLNECFETASSPMGRETFAYEHEASSRHR